MRLIRVAPEGDGWIVTLDGSRQGGAYASGAAAERAARSLAGRLAADGDLSEIEIELRDRSLAGRLRCWWGAIGPVMAPAPTLTPQRG